MHFYANSNPTTSDITHATFKYEIHLNDVLPAYCGWSNFQCSSGMPFSFTFGSQLQPNRSADSGIMHWISYTYVQNPDGTPAATNSAGNFYSHGMSLFPFS